MWFENERCYRSEPFMFSVDRPEGWQAAFALATVSRMHVSSRFKDIPQRIFLDSSALQTLQTYGGFLYESEPLSPRDRIYRDPKGVAKLENLRWIMQVAERAPFQFALSRNSFIEVQRRGDTDYLKWAYDVLDHSQTNDHTDVSCHNENPPEFWETNFNGRSVHVLSAAWAAGSVGTLPGFNWTPRQ